MTDETPIIVYEGDLRRIYAELNAHNCIIRSLLRVLTTGGTAQSLEAFRTEAMEEADTLGSGPRNPNKEFIEQGKIETLACVRDVFLQVKTKRQ